MTRTLALTPALLLLLAGCTVGPNYEQPEAAKPANWSEPAEGGATSAPVELATWWTALNDPQLDSLVDRAVQANLDLRIAAARVREARALRGIVSADLFPQVDVQGSYTRSRDSENAFRNDNFQTNEPSSGSDLYQAGFDASWEIDVFGRVRRSIEAADADIAASMEARRDVLVTVLAEVARNYVEVRGFQNRLLIAQDNIKSQRENLDLTKARFDAGLGTDLDVARAEAQLAATSSQIPALETGAKQAVHRLGVLMGLPPGTLLEELASAAPIPSIPNQAAIGLPADLLRRRPDIRRSERNLAAATARIGEATADLYPRFSLTGSFGLSSTQFGDWPSGDSRFWSIGPAVRWPIFDAGRIRSNIAVRDARQEEALATYERTVLSAFEEVENALIAYSREQTRRQSIASAVASNKRAVELANQLYSRGLADFLSVIDAQRNLYLTQDELVQSDRTVTANFIALYKAVGGGWEAFEPPAEENSTAQQDPVNSPTQNPAAPPEANPPPTGV